jgi:hypothetical protein
MKAFIVFPVFVLGLAIGGFFVAVVDNAIGPFKASAPITASSSDVERLIQKLKPLSDAAYSDINSSNLSVDFFGDGSVWISVEKSGNKTEAHGQSFNDAIAELRTRSAAIAGALK